MRVLINNIQKKERVPQKKIVEKCQKILDKLFIKNYELSILITDNKHIKKINNDYRNKNRSTNIISFPPEQKFKKLHNSILGDIALSMETVKKEAKTYKITINQRLSQLLIHAILHLLGYKHSKEMEEKSLELLRAIEKKPLPFI